MATAKTARVVRVEPVGRDGRLLEFEPAEPLGFVGGQYVIVNTQIVLPGGKIAKRAYSILSSDRDQRRFQIAVRRLGDGPGSTFMHSLSPGDEVLFSGPWGKFLPDDSRPRRTLVVATHTGITAALGLVRGERFAPQLATTTLVWLHRDPFLSAEVAQSLISAPIDDAIPAERPESAFLCGDGAVIYPLRDALAPADVKLEAFFNNPERRAP
jgi:ferredoxin-NADP reductase